MQVTEVSRMKCLIYADLICIRPHESSSSNVSEIKCTIDSNWLSRFLTRHSDVSVRKRTSKSIAQERKFSIEKAQRYNSILWQLSDKGFLDDPRRILNLVESDFQLGCSEGRVLAKKAELWHIRKV